MNDIVNIIKNLEGVRFMNPASAADIINAQNELGVRFAEEYRRYIEEYGAISAKGIELTGMTSHERLSVVSVTRKERCLNPNIPQNMYVIESIAIGGLVALQDETGRVYLIAPNDTPRFVYNSLAEYVKASKA